MIINTIDNKLLEESAKIILLDILEENHNIPEVDKYDMQVWINEMSYEECLSYFFEKDPDKVITEGSNRRYEGKIKTALKFGLAYYFGRGWAAKGIKYAWRHGKEFAINHPYFAGTLAVFYIYRKLSDECVTKCFKEFVKGFKNFSPFTQRKLCKYNCRANAAKKVLEDIRNEMKKCGQTNNPAKCEKRLNKEYKKWSERYDKELRRLTKIHGEAR